MSDDEPVFTVDQIATANTAMRVALGLPPEHFTLVRFVGMVANEIEQLRGAGWSDEAIADLVTEATGTTVGPDDITRCYSGPERR